MKLITFTYTKTPDQVSHRVLLTLAPPRETYFGIDITELDVEQQGLFEAKAKEAYDKYTQEINELMQSHDIKYNYRSFIPDKMTDVVVEG